MQAPSENATSSTRKKPRHRASTGEFKAPRTTANAFKSLVEQRRFQKYVVISPYEPLRGSFTALPVEQLLRAANNSSTNYQVLDLAHGVEKLILAIGITTVTFEDECMEHFCCTFL